jgi:hypothetical protein
LTVTELPTYHRHTLAEAEFCAARMELATESSYSVERVGPSLYRIAPGRLIAAVSHVLDEYPPLRKETE